MNRIDQRFARLREAQRCALIPFVTCGDPATCSPVELMHQLVDQGADLIELGMPFSDPMADGPVIQAASERALANGMTLNGVLQVVAEFRQDDPNTPVVLMGYCNPIVRRGQARFAQEAAAAGVDGLLLVDLPVEEEPEFRHQLSEQGIAPIMLVAPTTGAERRQRILAAAAGFVYYIRAKGVTGSRQARDHQDQDSAADLDALRAETHLPIAVGFGISDADGARTAAQRADAVVIGSALVKALAEAEDSLAAAADFIAPIRQALT